MSSDSDIDNSVDGLTIRITPFDNLFKFNLRKRDNPDDEDSLVAIDLDTASKYFMVFLKDDDSKLFIPEFKSPNFNKGTGEIAFKLNKQQSQAISHITRNDVFYVITRNPDGIETVIFSANFEMDQRRTTPRTPSFEDTFTVPQNVNPPIQQSGGST